MLLRSPRSQVKSPMDTESTFMSEISSTLSPASSSTHSDSDRWTESIAPSFVPDIGMLAGRAVLAVGNAQLRLLKRLWVRRRRRIVDLHFPHHEDYTAEGLTGMYVDLIDFSRCVHTPMTT